MLLKQRVNGRFRQKNEPNKHADIGLYKNYFIIFEGSLPLSLYVLGGAKLQQPLLHIKHFVLPVKKAKHYPYVK